MVVEKVRALLKLATWHHRRINDREIVSEQPGSIAAIHSFTTNSQWNAETTQGGAMINNLLNSSLGSLEFTTMRGTFDTILILATPIDRSAIVTPCLLTAAVHRLGSSDELCSGGLSLRSISFCTRRMDVLAALIGGELGSPR